MAASSNDAAFLYARHNCPFVETKEKAKNIKKRKNRHRSI